MALCLLEPQLMSDISDIHIAIKASEKFQILMQGLLPTLFSSVETFVESSNNPDINIIKNESLHVLNGAMVVHLFSMWDSHLGSAYVDKYFRPNEKERYYAFKHIRIVAAHNIDGNRKGNRNNQDRMDHAEKLDQIMNSEKPFKGLIIENYKLDLSQSYVALECRQFMQDMAHRLTGRIAVGGPYGQVRITGGGTTEVM